MRRTSRCHWRRKEGKGWGIEYNFCTSSTTQLKSWQPLDQCLFTQGETIIETTVIQLEKQWVGCNYGNWHANGNVELVVIGITVCCYGPEQLTFAVCGRRRPSLAPSTKKTSTKNLITKLRTKDLI
jgi:hypothetical protein